MFVRGNRVKGRDYLSLVLNERIEGRVRQRTILYLGRSDRVDRDVLAQLLKQLDAGSLPYRFRPDEA